MFREIHTQDIEARATAREIPRLLRMYDQAIRSAGVASYDEFNLNLLEDYRNDMLVLAQIGSDDYFYVHYGRNLVLGTGCDMTGSRVSDLPGELGAFTRKCYDQALGDRTPLYSVHRSISTQRITLWERLVLPVVASTGQKFVFAFTKALDFREELLGAVLDSSQNGIIALQAERNEAGVIDDAVIVTANRRACELSGRSERELIGAPVLSALPVLRQNGVWAGACEVMRTGEARHVEAQARLGGKDHWFHVSLAPLRDGVAITFSDVTELKLANLALQSRAATLAVEIGRERATTEALSSEINRQRRRESELRQLAETDPMTGLLNRRSFENRIQTAHLSTLETGQPFSLLYIDLDHFKAINDTHGHAAGDAAIQAATRRMQGRVRRENDVVARIGGEEFAVLLPNTRLEGAVRVAEMLRSAIAETQVPVGEGRTVKLSASIGVAEHLANEPLEGLLARVDEALYAAKGMGRDRVEIARRNALKGRDSRAA